MDGPEGQRGGGGGVGRSIEGEDKLSFWLTPTATSTKLSHLPELDRKHDPFNDVAPLH